MGKLQFQILCVKFVLKLVVEYVKQERTTPSIKSADIAIQFLKTVPLILNVLMITTFQMDHAKDARLAVRDAMIGLNVLLVMLVW